jgi:TRAP-type C4-dicarboxylate transport system permease small subunit
MLKTAGIDFIQTKKAGRVTTTKSKRNIYIYMLRSYFISAYQKIHKITANSCCTSCLGIT